MTTLPTYKIITCLAVLLILRLSAAACSCPGRLTTEQEYKRSDLVIQGRILGVDTIYSSNTLLNDRKGIKVGKHKYSVYTEKLLKVQMIVEKKFKSTSSLPDTVYILTSPEGNACGYPFPSFVGRGILPDSYYQFIVYGDSWSEKTIVKTKKGKRYVGQIKETSLQGTFFTSICRKTQHVNDDELKILSALKN